MSNPCIYLNFVIINMAMIKKVKKAVFPVGGLGTRFLPATKCMPKEMLPVVDKPLIQYAFEEARDSGIEEFIFITGRNKNIISNHFDHAYELQKLLDEKQKRELLVLARDWLPEAGKIAFIRQQEPLGLGHAIWCARHFIHDEPFAVLLADEMLMGNQPFLKEMINLHAKTGGNIIAVADIERKLTGSYGIVTPESDDGKVIKIKAMIEKPTPSTAPSTISITGRYILEPKIFEYLENEEKTSSGEVQLTGAMAKMLEDSDFYGLRFTGKRFDCGSKIGFLDATIAYALERPDLKDDMLNILKKYS